MSDDITYYDCNASLGRLRAGCYAPCPTAEELVAELDWHGVAGALVKHALMVEQSPVVGNQALLDAIAGQPRLWPTWAILPPQPGELGDAATFFRAMAAADVRALWAYPDDHRYLLNRATFGALLDEVAARRIPLFLPRNAGGPRPPDTYRLLHELLGDYPELTVVLTAQGPWGEDRYFRPLLERYPSFYLDLSRYELDQGLAELVARYGSDRLLYGSHFPASPMGGPRLMVARAEMPQAARRAIAGGNLRRLLEEVQR
ncbi:MAG: amidohydrolase family protein [Chloroflexota bacterium]